MAIDLLAPLPPKRMYRHDLESLFYIIFFASRYREGKEIANLSLLGWSDYGMRDLLRVKGSFLSGLALQPTNSSPTIKLWAGSFRGLFRYGFIARNKHLEASSRAVLANSSTQPVVFDDETLGGIVNFDKFSAILDTPV